MESECPDYAHRHQSLETKQSEKLTNSHYLVYSSQLVVQLTTIIDPSWTLMRPKKKKRHLVKWLLPSASSFREELIITNVLCTLLERAHIRYVPVEQSDGKMAAMIWVCWVLQKQRVSAHTQRRWCPSLGQEVAPQAALGDCGFLWSTNYHCHAYPRLLFLPTL